MISFPPPEEPISNFDFSALSKRIAEVKSSDATMSQKQLAKSFIKTSILPILNTPQIYQMLQNPAFVEQFSDLLVSFLVTAPKVVKQINE